LSPGVKGRGRKGALAPEESFEMSTPKHRTAPASSHFVTGKCWQGRAVSQGPGIEFLVQTRFHYRERNAYQPRQFAAMPNPPPGANRLERAVRLIRGGSSHAVPKQREQKMQIWQEVFHHWSVRDADDRRSKVEYIGLNPVRARLGTKPDGRPYSSASARFAPDPLPARYSRRSSGANAPSLPRQRPARKLRPPEEHEA
jgi:hypothetical protein